MNMLRKKVGKFIVEHGYTSKGWLVAMVICPPAAVYIPFKIPSISRVARIGMLLLTVVVHGMLITGSFAVIGVLIVRAIHRIFAL